MSAVVVAVIAAVASIAAAVVAGMFALASRRFEARLQRVNQVSEHKRDMYVPLVDMLERMFTSDEVPTAEELAHKRRFDTWGQRVRLGRRGARVLAVHAGAAHPAAG